MFNPSGAEAVRSVVDAWAAAFLRLVLLLPTHPDVARDAPAMCAATFSAAPGDVSCIQTCLAQKSVSWLHCCSDVYRHSALRSA